MLKKMFVSAAVAATAVAAMAVGTGSASAATFVPAGVYPSSNACADAGNAGFPQGRWVGWRCESLGGGQYLLWVQPTY
ncbi:hypothetical protein QFZ63_003274 [Streptomyces sp. B3I7]|jgi:hypothetical protein|uniref:hypothetical protein n=1 Tax=unclassified Streptomyces TaxID=2593676 RepID=UPI002781B0F0|nr:MULTISPECIES: hypothetical protein [unclassified Streptomyces]MDQ0788834.1 hypothetical protein [Streptomyces sp. B3I8]MDQ0811560.1 hypothetical protein [Streptomyces sp. B3I7]